MTGRHQRDDSEIALEVEAEVESYLDLYDDDEQIDGSRQLPERGGRHARREQQ